MGELRTAESHKARVWQELWAAHEQCQDPCPLVSPGLEVLEPTSAGEQHSLKYKIHAQVGGSQTRPPHSLLCVQVVTTM